MSNDRAHPIFQALADAICPPAGDDLAENWRSLGKHLDSPGAEAGPDPVTEDDVISRLDLVRWLEDEGNVIRRRMRPESGWAEQDLARLYLLRRIVDYVNQMPACKSEMWGAK